MKESYYLSKLSGDLEKDLHCKIYKISDRSTLGLPDSMILKDGIVTFIETKVAYDEDYLDKVLYVAPWKTVKKDIRQFEVCKEMSKNALVLYCIHYPQVNHTTVLTMNMVEQFRGLDKWLNNPMYLRPGNGLEQIKMFMIENKEKMRVKINGTIS